MDIFSISVKEASSAISKNLTVNWTTKIAAEYIKNHQRNTVTGESIFDIKIWHGSG
jgi:hypothetical protein